MTSNGASPSVLADPKISLAFMDRRDRLQSMQNRIRQAEEDVQNDRNQAKEKQKLLDTSDRVRESMVSHTSAARTTGGGIPNVGIETETVWAAAVNLLGSGAERLEANVKRVLIRKVVKISLLIIERWTQAHLAVDFINIKRDVLSNEEIISNIAKSDSTLSIESAKSILESIVDLMELVFAMQPFLGTVSYLCEEARDIVLAESIINTPVQGDMEELLRNLWLSDIDVQKGKKGLNTSIKRAPKSKLLRSVITAQLMARVYWKHWRKEDRLSLLNAADLSLKGVGQRYKTGELQRLVENLPDSEFDT